MFTAKLTVLPLCTSALRTTGALSGSPWFWADVEGACVAAISANYLYSSSHETNHLGGQAMSKYLKLAFQTLAENPSILDLCYTYRVINNQQIWQKWVDSLQHWGISDLAAVLLDALGPLNLLGAQCVYFGQPLLEQFLPDGHTRALASMLEDVTQTKEFVTYLRQKDEGKLQR
jgi:hypothetical protein